MERGNTETLTGVDRSLEGERQTETGLEKVESGAIAPESDLTVNSNTENGMSEQAQLVSLDDDSFVPVLTNAIERKRIKELKTALHQKIAELDKQIYKTTDLLSESVPRIAEKEEKQENTEKIERLVEEMKTVEEVDERLKRVHRNMKSLSTDLERKAQSLDSALLLYLDSAKGDEEAQRGDDSQ